MGKLAFISISECRVSSARPELRKIECRTKNLFALNNELSKLFRLLLIKLQVLFIKTTSTTITTFPASVSTDKSAAAPFIETAAWKKCYNIKMNERENYFFGVDITTAMRSPALMRLAMS